MTKTYNQTPHDIDNILVSVVVPIYSVEKYLVNCIESIINQTYKNLEIILVDDGSPDECPRICDYYAKKDNRIKVIHKKNGGLSDARNAGIAKITGSYVVFIDSDDYWDLNLVSQTLHVCDKYNLDICIFGYYEDSYNNNGNKTRSIEFAEDSKIINKNSSKKNNIYNLHTLGYAWNKMYKTSIIVNNHLCFETGLSYIEDIDFNANAITVAHKIGFVDKCLYHYAKRQEKTLGNRYYNNIFELDKIAINASLLIFKELNLSPPNLNKLYAQVIYTRLRSTIHIIIKSSKISWKKKVANIRLILDWYNKNTDNDHLQLSNKKDRVSIYLFKNNHVYILIFLTIAIDLIHFCKKYQKLLQTRIGFVE